MGQVVDVTKELSRIGESMNDDLKRYIKQSLTKRPMAPKNITFSK